MPACRSCARHPLVARRAASSVSARVCSSGIIGSQPVAARRRSRHLRRAGDLLAPEARRILHDLDRAAAPATRGARAPLASTTARPDGHVVRPGRAPTGRAAPRTLGPTSRTSVMSRLRREVTDAHRSAAGFLRACDLGGPRADREPFVPAGPFVLEGAGDDDVEPGTRRTAPRRALRPPSTPRTARRRATAPSSGVGTSRRLPVDLSRRHDERARTGSIGPDALEDVHGTEGVHAPRLGCFRPRGGDGRDRREMHDALGARRGDGSGQPSALVTSASSGGGPPTELREQMAADEALASSHRIEPVTARPYQRVIVSRCPSPETLEVLPRCSWTGHIGSNNGRSSQVEVGCSRR